VAGLGRVAVGFANGESVPTRRPILTGRQDAACGPFALVGRYRVPAFRASGASCGADGTRPGGGRAGNPMVAAVPEYGRLMTCLADVGVSETRIQFGSCEGCEMAE
jgi:hypothetical protein